MRWAQVALVVLVATAAHAARDPRVRCESAKLEATATAARRLLICHARAAGSGRPVAATCLDQATFRFTSRFAQIEIGNHSCPTPGDATAIATLLGNFVDATAAALRPVPGTSSCAARKLAALAKDMLQLGRLYAHDLRTHDDAALADGLGRANAVLADGFAKIEAKGDCVTTGDAATAASSANDVFAGRCGDGLARTPEQCDGADAAACPSQCRSDCTCPIPPTSFTCLTQPGPLVTLAGTYATPYQNYSVPADLRLDARAATLLSSPANLYPLNLNGGAGTCIAGGTVQGSYATTLTWADMHGLNNAGVRFENAGVTVDGVRVDDVTDGIRPVGGPFTIRGVWISWVRDDCVEDDHLKGGVIEDSLFDGCYAGISERPSPDIVAEGADGRGDALTIRSSLMRLQPMPGPDGGLPTDVGHGAFFKWDGLATQLVLRDNVFMAEQVGFKGPSTMDVPDRIAACSNNVMVWLGPGPYPVALPTCFTITTDRRVWDDAVAAWKVRHPAVGAP
jgi:hypothetical protein